MEINYQTDPEVFANCAFVDISLFDCLPRLLEEPEHITAPALIQLLVLVEAMVFHDQLVLIDQDDDDAPILGVNHFDGRYFGVDIDEVIAEFMLSGAIDTKEDRTSIGNAVEHEISMLCYPTAGSSIVLVHGDHVSASHPEGAVAIDWKDGTAGWDQTYIDALRKHGYYRAVSDPTNLAIPWKLLANCHGVPLLDGNLGFAQEVHKGGPPSSIGVELYRQLEELHAEYFASVRRYLGNSYLTIPPILAMVLGECRGPEDIAKAILSVRKHVSDFRDRCTDLEEQLRLASKQREQLEVLLEIEAAYKLLCSHAQGEGRRLGRRLLTVVKEIEPVGMAKKAASEAADYLMEEHGHIKFQGYLDMWTSALEVEQALPMLRQVFGDAIRPNLVERVSWMARSNTRGAHSALRPS